MKSIYITIMLLLFTILLHSQTEWFKYPGNPVLIPGPEGWDIGAVAFGKVLLDGSEYKMWYTGGTTVSDDLQIGYAFSTDRIHWTKYSANPVLIPGGSGSWESGAVGTPTVIRDGDTLKMWYAASVTNPPNQLQIGYAKSTDGIQWMKHPNNPVLELGSSGEWDDYWVTLPTVVKDGSTYKMWYTGSRQPLGTERIGYATSPDGINWSKYDDPTTTNPPYSESDPVLVTTPGSWDSYLVYQPCIILNNSVFEIWYAGSDGSTQSIGHASSMDGIIWDKDSTNPVLTESSALLAPSVIKRTNYYDMWYTGSNRRINYASTDPTVDVDDENKLFVASFILSQNYPNPFNPSTVIGYQLPVSSNVTLKVYDLLGREVATLVDEYKPVGSYKMEFDATELTSGIYFYKLQADNHIETKKMILLK